MTDKPRFLINDIVACELRCTEFTYLTLSDCYATFIVGKNYSTKVFIPASHLLPGEKAESALFRLGYVKPIPSNPLLDWLYDT